GSGVMKEMHWIVIIPKAPIHIGGPKPDFIFLPTNDVIPGSVLRGALAEYLIAQGRESEIKSFVESMGFGFLLPSKYESRYALPLPSTSLTCKDYI
ncbi:MAG: hypothetical protein ACE5J3_03690, partial [Methanosarcinales archaeon]